MIDGEATYEVVRDGRTLIGPSAIRPRLAGKSSFIGARVVSVKRGACDSQFAVPWGKSAQVVDRHSCAIVALWTDDFAWSVELRAYDEGVAFRYAIARQSADKPMELREELTEFAIQGEPRVLFDVLDGFTTSHEALFQFLPLENVPTGRLMDCPALLVWPDGQAAAITEARIRHFAGMYLERASEDSTTFRCRLSPLPGRANACIAPRFSLKSPWRVVLLADAAGKLLESNLLLCLNDPPRGNYQWLQPGKTTFPWWNGEFEEDYKLALGDPTFLQRHRAYIDFCAENGIAYHAVSGDGRPWYVQSGGDYSTPSADADVRKPRPEIQLPAILAYARERDVGVRLWVHWKPLTAHLDEAFEQYESWGIKGLMVDFVDRDDQQMNEFIERMLQCAARHKLHIQIHGSPKNGGEQRTFPHLFNREGALNLEYLKWSDLCTPQHNVNVAYTRALTGPVDYHLGGFRSVSRENFQPRTLHPTVLGSRSHHLALYVVYENPLPMVADAPSVYAGQAGFDFIRDVPTTWDETRFVAGEPGEYIVAARRKNDAWYVGGITNWTSRDMEIPLKFFASQENEYDAALYTDGSPNASRPNDVAVSRLRVTASTPLRVFMSSGGGFVARLTVCRD